MNFIDDGTERVDYVFIDRNILDGNVINMSLMITKGNYGAIYADDSSYDGYYIIIFSLSPYTLQADLNIYGQVISSGEMVCEGTYYFPININSHYYVSPKNKSNNTILHLRIIINGNVNVKFYDYNDVVPSYLITI